MCGGRKWQREKSAKIDGENGSEEKSYAQQQKYIWKYSSPRRHNSEVNQLCSQTKNVH
jgi:hypothetical protein